VQARGAYKEVPRASRRLALATPESPWDVHPCKGQNTPYTYLQVDSDIITEEMARTISRLLNNIVLGLDRILNKALKTYRLLKAP
jgi:hypothetical protein